MKKVIVYIVLFLPGIISAQQTHPSFLPSKNNSFGKNFLLGLSASAYRTECNFRLSAPQRKPVFCRMEDKLYGKFNIWLQLRAGSDQEYRKLAFPEKTESNKRSKSID